ncbi:MULTISPECIES: conjugal transfer protein MobA [Muribaculaceae]|uniref:MobA protein n=1 Tax=Paramuribaculum intestinale TaxID=2094151 RepID=A0A2V1IW30_9BACT|nr:MULTISPECIES: conjugal transfer protein MobA [Muribaculaceae]MBJ2186903.1 MobA protein [Muribaculaceae bacterium]ROS90842.1 MobA protein [Muribaculaceae bacterium Isolate-043 (Harlan)]PWB06072.1 MobA protein [Paramuribaculum intestinale]PWB06454.1 MobA protein [Paramuribaculum intestinale]WLT42443.1 MobA protein [Paramuribaculum intestinale]
MSNNYRNAGRKPKLDPTVFRCTVNFNAQEHARLIAMHERSGVESMAAFIKMQFFGKPFKVFVIDENTRKFIDRLSSLNSQYRTLGVSYDTLVKTLRENFTEKKAMTALYRLEQYTKELARINRQIVDLANKFDEQWLLKSH